MVWLELQIIFHWNIISGLTEAVGSTFYITKDGLLDLSVILKVFLWDWLLISVKPLYRKLFTGPCPILLGITPGLYQSKIIWDEYSNVHQTIIFKVYRSFQINYHLEQYIKSLWWLTPFEKVIQCFIEQKIFFTVFQKARAFLLEVPPIFLLVFLLHGIWMKRVSKLMYLLLDFSGKGKVKEVKCSNFSTFSTLLGSPRGIGGTSSDLVGTPWSWNRNAGWTI